MARTSSTMGESDNFGAVMMHWLSMGGYGFYVGLAYGLVSFFLLLNIVGCRWQKKRIESALRRWFKQSS